MIKKKNYKNNNNNKLKKYLKKKNEKKIVFLSKIKKRFLIYLIKLGFWLKKRVSRSLFLKKVCVQNIFYKNLKKINNILKKSIYIKMNLYRKRKNVFLNFSNIFSGNVYTSYSCGHYYKRSLRKTYYAIESLLLKSSILEKNFFNKFWINNKKKKRIWLFLIVKGDYYSKGFKKNIIKFIFKKKIFYKMKTIRNIQFKAHNGIRQKSKRRK